MSSIELKIDLAPVVAAKITEGASGSNITCAYFEALGAKKWHAGYSAPTELFSKEPGAVFFDFCFDSLV